MLSITKKAKELSDQELSLIPTIRAKFVPSNAGAVMSIEFGDLSVFENIPKHQILKLFEYSMSWADIMAGGEFVRELPLRIYIGKTENYRGRYYRYELILPGRGAISSMLPERIRDYLKQTQGRDYIDHIHLVDGEWL